MAEFVTHSLLGAASNPTSPIWGGVLGNASDGAQVLAAGYLSVKQRRLVLNIWDYYYLWPEWIRKLNAYLHSIWVPLFVLYFCLWMRLYDSLPFVLAYLSHVVLDIFTHDTSEALMPFSGHVLRLGHTYHSIENMKRGSWKVVVAMIMIAAVAVIVSQP